MTILRATLRLCNRDYGAGWRFALPAGGPGGLHTIADRKRLEEQSYRNDTSIMGNTRLSDGPDSLVLRFMRQVGAKLNRVTDDLADIKVGLTNVEENLVALNRRADRMDLRFECIERRLGLTETAGRGFVSPWQVPAWYAQGYQRVQ